MFSIEEKKIPLNQNSQIYFKNAPQQHILKDDKEIHTRPLEWLKTLYIEEGGYHPCFGVPLTLYLNLLQENVIDLAAYPEHPLEKLTKLKNNGLGIEELDQRINLPFQIIENAKDVFRDKISITPKMKKFNLSIKEFVETHQKLGLPWAYSSITIFGGDTPLTKNYLENLTAKKLKLTETSKKLMQLAIDLLPPARMHDTDTHFYIRKEEIVKGMNLRAIKDQISSVIADISQNQSQPIARDKIISKCFSNYFKFPASKASLITFGIKECTWDIIIVWEPDPKKVPSTNLLRPAWNFIFTTLMVIELKQFGLNVPTQTPGHVFFTPSLKSAG